MIERLGLQPEKQLVTVPPSLRLPLTKVSKMNNVIPLNNIVTMSSREIANLLGKEHSNIKISAERLRDSGTLAMQESPFDHNGNEYTEYLFDKKSSILLVAQNCPEFTAAIIDRWQELEGDTPKIPQTMAEALRLAADQAEQLEEQALKIEQDAPKVEFVDSYVESEGLRGLQEAAKSLGFRPRSFTESLKADKYLYRAGNALLPIQRFLQQGIFRVVEGERAGHNFNQTKITAKGMIYFAKRYATELGE